MLQHAEHAGQLGVNVLNVKACAEVQIRNKVAEMCIRDRAKTLAAHGCDFNIVIGLCVGHDTLFLRHSKVPTTVMIVKDRVLQHNPVAALYGVQLSLIHI